MLIGFSLVFVIVVGLIYLFFGIVWKHSDSVNISIKLTAFLVAFGSAYVAVNCSSLPMFYVIAVGLISLFFAAIWSSEGTLNVGIKALFSAITCVCAFVVISP
jgi:hypothetical protein